MIKNKYKFFVFSISFLGLLLILAATPATESSNKFIAGMCLGFVLSQAIFILWFQEYLKDESEEEENKNKIINKKPNYNYNSEYWWNSGIPPKLNEDD